MSNIQSYNKLHDFFESLRSDFSSEGLEGYAAMDIASDVLRCNQHISDSITEHYPDVTDQVVFLAEQIVG